MNTMQLVVLFLFLFSPFSCVFAQELNAGFVQGVWYSKTPFFAEETIRIYTAIQNNSGFDIQGTIEFLVNNNSVGESAFSIINGRIVETWTDWKVTKGNHLVSAHIKEAFKIEIGKAPELISLRNIQIGTSEIFADQDTDKDGIGNIEDKDDDNDLILDATEEALGTNPLKTDSDEDGLLDNKEIELGTNPLNEDTDQDGISDAIEVAQGSNPIVAEQTLTGIIPNASVDQKEKPIFENLTQQVTEDIIPTIGKTIDGFVENTVEKLTEQRKEIQQKKEFLSTAEQGFDFLLASAIITLPQWKIGLFLFFAIATALLLRRFSRKEIPD